MPLVEVIRGAKTSDATVARTVAANALGKKPWSLKIAPAFGEPGALPLFRRLQFIGEGWRGFSNHRRCDGALGWPMGPAYLLDVVGLDTAVHAQDVMAQGFPDRMQEGYESCVVQLYKAARLGQKNQKAFTNMRRIKR